MAESITIRLLPHVAAMRFSANENSRSWELRRAVVAACATLLMFAGGQAQDTNRALLLHPEAPEWHQRAPGTYRVRLETGKGSIEIEVVREWAPRGADRFYNLVRYGYYDDTRFFRVIKDRWAQFGVSGDPAISAAWRNRMIPDDPRKVSNTLGRVAFAFAAPNGRATQVFINLRDNSQMLDAQGFAPFGRVVEGMGVAQALNSQYGESSGSGIRAGRQGPLFAEGNAYLDREFPKLDRLLHATIDTGRR